MNGVVNINLNKYERVAYRHADRPSLLIYSTSNTEKHNKFV